MTLTLIPRAGGAKVVATTDFEKFWDPIINDYIRTGLTIAAQCPNILGINLSCGDGRLNGLYVTNTATLAVNCLTVCTTNYIIGGLSRDGCCRPTAFVITSSTMCCVTADQILLGRAVTNCMTVTSVGTCCVIFNPTDNHVVSNLPDILTAGAALSADQVVMICGNLSVAVATTAGAAKTIGVMKKAVSCGVKIDHTDMIVYGIADVVADGCITAGDRLTISACTAGRVITNNTQTLCHSHTAFTVSAGAEAQSSNQNSVLEGSGAQMVDNDRFLGLSVSNVTGRGADNRTATTSTNTAGTITHGIIIGKALEGSTAGTTFKILFTP